MANTRGAFECFPAKPETLSKIIGGFIFARHSNLGKGDPAAIKIFLPAGFTQKESEEVQALAGELCEEASRRCGGRHRIGIMVIRSCQYADGLNLAQFAPEALQAFNDHVAGGGWLLTEGEETLMSLQGIKARWMNFGTVRSIPAGSVLGERNIGDPYLALNPSPGARRLRGFPVVNETILPSLDRVSGNGPAPSDIPAHWTEHQMELSDGEPVYVTALRLSKQQQREFALELVPSNPPRPLGEVCRLFNAATGHAPYFATSGGYFIDRRLVERNFLPGELLGCPVDLCVTEGRLLSLPIAMHRPVLCTADGKIRIEHVPREMRIEIDGLTCGWVTPGVRSPGTGVLRVELGMWGGLQDGNRQVAGVDILGDRILRIVEGDASTLSCWRLIVPRTEAPKHWAAGARVAMKLLDPAWRTLQTAIAAGPTIIIDGRTGIVSSRLEKETWWHSASQLLQFSPVDMEDLRTARCVCCTLNDGGFGMFVISGRTFESVGATHDEAAWIGQKIFGGEIVEAMEFDCGGSVSCRNADRSLSILNYVDEKGRLSERPVGNALVLSRSPA